MVRCWVLRYEEAINSLLAVLAMRWAPAPGYIVEMEDASQKKVKSCLL